MVGRVVSFSGFLALHSMHIRTSQKLFSAAVSYHLCPLSHIPNAHEHYAYADNASQSPDAFWAWVLLTVAEWGGRFTGCVMYWRMCKIAVGVHTTCRVS